MLCLLFGFACSDGGSDRTAKDRGRGTPSATAPSSGDTWTNINGEGSTPPDLVECAELTAEGVRSSEPLDIVWAIDSSGSMGGEASIVQDNMNVFAESIVANNVNVRVVVMADHSFVDVPPPLGTDNERYRFVDVRINSHDALKELVENFALYQDFLRPTGLTHFVIVTDDDSRQTVDWFRSAMSDLLGRDFIVHAIASEAVEGKRCEGPNGRAHAVGEVYLALTEATGGQFFSICTSDWRELFDSLRTEMVQSVALDCSFPIPELPPGERLHPGGVNVAVTDGQGQDTTLPRAADMASCQDKVAWYFDDNEAPAEIHLCPAACAEVNTYPPSTIRIIFGCETVELLI
jgi:hypothetical protein